MIFATSVEIPEKISSLISQKSLRYDSPKWYGKHEKVKKSSFFFISYKNHYLNEISASKISMWELFLIKVTESERIMMVAVAWGPPKRLKKGPVNQKYLSF